MKIIALEQECPLSAPGYTAAVLRDEARRVWQLQQEGMLREIYFRADQHSAVLILECHDVAEAQAVLASLPLVQAGLITFEVIPLAPYDGFVRLFEKG